MISLADYIDESIKEVQATGLDPLLVDKPGHTMAIAASIKQRIAFGDRIGQKIITI